MTEPRVDYDALKQRIIATNARLLDNTFEAYTRGHAQRKQEFVAEWRTAFDRVSDPDALRDGSDGMLLNGILMEAIMKGEVKSDFADWVFPGERARRLARALEELARVSGIVPRYNRRDMPAAISAYRAKRPQLGGSFSSRLSASLSGDAADAVEDWMLHRGDWAPYEARGDRTRSVFSGLNKDSQQLNLAEQMADLQKRIDEAYANRMGAVAAQLEGELAELQAQAGPTIDQQMADLQQQIDAAYAARQGGKAAELEAQLEALQASAQPSLAEQMADLQKRIDEAYANRMGAVAAQLEGELAELQAQAGPTIDQQMADLQQQIDAAYAARQGGKAAELEAQLEALKLGDRTIQLAQSVRQPIAAPTAAQTVVNGPVATDSAALEAKRQEVEAVVSAKTFRVSENKARYLQNVFAARTLAELEAIRQNVVGL